MSAHLTDDLPRLLTGEATRAETLAAAEHLRSCVDCQQELVSAVVAHASLTSAHRFAPDVVAGPGAVGTASDAADHDADRPSPPDLSAVFAQVRREAAEDFAPSQGTRSHRRSYLLAAAAAVVVAGGGIGIYAATSGTDEPATRSVALSAFDRGHTSATARIGDGTVELTATSLPRLTGKRYEVWLTDAARTRMQPIGWIGGNGTARLTVPADMMRQYQDIEVSVQDLHAHGYNYSGESVLRGPID